MVGRFQHRVAALASCRTALVTTGLIISQHVGTNGRKNNSPSLECMGVVKVINYLRTCPAKKLLHFDGTRLVHAVQQTLSFK